MDECESVSDRRRRLTRPRVYELLTRQRVQRHRGRTAEARSETAKAADHKRLGRQNEVDVRSLSLVVMFCNCQIASREASLRGQPRMH